MEEALLVEWLPVFVLAGVAVLFVLGNFTLSKLLGDDRPLFSKLSPYESGNEPEGLAQENVSIHYSLVGVLFILFDIEIIFMYPWVMTINHLPAYLWTSVASVSVFVVILAVGYFYAWREGAFEWK